MEGVYLILWRTPRVLWRKRRSLTRRKDSAEERFGLRLRWLQGLDGDRLDDRLIGRLERFLRLLLFERPPERPHAGIVVFVAHGRAFGPQSAWRIQDAFSFRAETAAAGAGGGRGLGRIGADNIPITFKR